MIDSARSRRITMRFILAAVAFACLFAIVSPAASQSDDLDVLKMIPENYKLLLDNPFVRVIEARVPPGTTEPPHRHLRGVSVCDRIHHRVPPGAKRRVDAIGAETGNGVLE
jgi:hypothetical protein